MTIPMPEPVGVIGSAYSLLYARGETIPQLCRRTGATIGSHLITTTQAEAYADARVAESQRWISVNDQLPETGPGSFDQTQVLAFWTTTDPDCDPGGIEASWFDGRHWQGANGEMDYHGARRVTHWMTLPAPPSPAEPNP